MPPTRRQILHTAVAATVVGTGGLHPPLATAEESKPMLKGRVKQSVVFWCFNARGEKWDAEKTCAAAKDLGCASVEIIEPQYWPTLRKHGLTCAIAPNGMPGAP